MKSYPGALQGLVEQLMKLPGIGRKTAARLAFHIVRMPGESAQKLAAAIIDVKSRLTLCSFCQNLTESDPCPLCRDAARDSHQLCVVEYPADVASIENSGAFKGRYFVLHGTLAPMQGLGPEDLRLEKLRQIVVEQKISEVVLATNPTVEGNATESLTVVGNNKAWGIGSALTFTDNPFVNNADTPIALTGSGGVNRRENVKMGAAGSVFPSELHFRK